MLATGRNGSMAWGLVGVSLLAFAASTACSGDKTSDGSTIGNSTPSGGMVGSGGATTSGGATVATGGPIASGGALQLIPVGGTTGDETPIGHSGTGVGGGCAATFVQAKVKTLAMFIMLDQSKSMDQIVDMKDDRSG